MNEKKIPRRIQATILSAVSGGVVPRLGAPYIAIGRNDEIAALSADLSRVGDGGGSVRFLIGRYGSGKSFLIQLMRGNAAERGFVTADCDLSPERRLSGSGGLSTYRELIKNLSCKASPDGGALQMIIGKWYSQITARLVEKGHSPTDPSFASRVSAEIISDASEFENAVGGFDFALIVGEYCKAYGEGDDRRMSSCLKWLRGEYNNKTEARAELGLRGISVIDDGNWYDRMKLICALCVKVGYKGLCIFIDEGVNLYKISNRISREANYEKILSMYNDIIQGKAPSMMLIFGGTPQFLEDTRRGLFSYEALRSRLCDGDGSMLNLAPGEIKSMMGPVIRLKRLSDNELLALLMRLSDIYCGYYETGALVTEEEMASFVSMYADKVGASTMMTPREVIRDFIRLLDILLQNPDRKFADLAPSAVRYEAGDAEEDEEVQESRSAGVQEGTKRVQEYGSNGAERSGVEGVELDQLLGPRPRACPSRSESCTGVQERKSDITLDDIVI